MMDIATINEMNREAGDEARDEGREPYVFSAHDLLNLKNGDLFPIRKIPRLGDYEPDGWEHVESLFVDSSGFGRPGEPALTAEQFAKRVKPEFGYGIGAVGQFQLHVEAYKKLA